MSSIKKIISSIIWYKISNVITKGIGFLTAPIFARIMSKNQFGAYSNFITWLNLLATVVSANLYVSVNRAKLDFPKELDNYCSSILLFGTGITSFFYIITGLKVSFFEQLFSMEAFYIHIMFIYLLVQPALEIFQIKQRVLYEYKISVILSIIATLVTTLTSVILVLTIEDKFKGRVIGYILPLIILNSALYLYFGIKGKTFNLDYCKYAFRYSWPFIPHLLATYILSASDRIMITNFCGNDYTAIYTMACNCMSIATLFLTSLNNAITPWIFEKLNCKEENQIRKVTFPYCIIFFLIVQMAFLISPELLWILGGTQYVEAKFAIVPLLTSIIMQFAYCLYVNIEQYSGRTWAIALGTTIAAGTNIGLNLFLLPQYGYWIAAYTTLVGYIVLFFVHYLFVKMIGYKNIYNDKIVFIMIIIAILEQPLILFLYNYVSIRYFILAVELLILGCLYPKARLLVK